VLERLRDAMPDGLDYTLDTTGREETILCAIGSLATMGKCGVVAMPHGPIALDPRSLMVGGRSLVGIIEGDSRAKTFIPELIEHYRAGRFPIQRLIKFYDFGDIDRAMADMQAGLTVKPVLRMAPARKRQFRPSTAPGRACTEFIRRVQRHAIDYASAKPVSLRLHAFACLALALAPHLLLAV